MSFPELCKFSLQPLARRLHRWWLRRQLDHIRYQLAHLRHQRENDRHVERVLMGREALLRSDLRNS